MVIQGRNQMMKPLCQKKISICDSVCMIGRLEGCPLSQAYSRSSTARAIEVPAVYKATPHS